LSRHFDKDEDRKLSMEELREVMVSMGEGPLLEKEFNSFIKVFYLTSLLLLNFILKVFQCLMIFLFPRFLQQGLPDLGPSSMLS
jgi:hypothetical protein